MTQTTKQLKHSAFDAAFVILENQYHFESTILAAKEAAKSTGYRYWYSQFMSALTQSKS